MEGALGDGTVPEEGNGNATVRSELGRRRGPDGDGKTGGHDPVGAEDPDAGVGDVHRAAPTTVRP